MSKTSFFELVRKRRSIGAFRTDKKIPKSAVDRILRVCDMAPSSGGLQTFEIYRVDGQEKKTWLAAAAKDQPFVAEAPLLLVFCANASRSVQRFGERSQLFSIRMPPFLQHTHS